MKKELLKKQIENCEKCHNERHVTVDNKRIRCVCYNTATFLHLFEQADADETQIDKEIVLILKNLFKKHRTVIIYENGPALRVKYQNSSLYLATRHLFSAKSSSDIDIIDAVFNKEENQTNTFIMSRYLSHDFLCLTIGAVHNDQFISQYILEILIKRKQLNLKTLVLIPSNSSVMSKYKDVELVSYLESLGAEGASLTPILTIK